MIRADEARHLLVCVVVLIGEPTPSQDSIGKLLQFSQRCSLWRLGQQQHRGVRPGFGKGLELSSIALAGSADETAALSAIQQMWAQIGVKLAIEQLDNASRTARYRAGDFQMRCSLWTDDIADPCEITSYFAYFPNIQSLHSGYEDKTINQLYEDAQKQADAATRAATYKQKVSLTGPDGKLNGQGQTLIARTFLAAFGLLPEPGYHPRG